MVSPSPITRYDLFGERITRQQQIGASADGNFERNGHFVQTEQLLSITCWGAQALIINRRIFEGLAMLRSPDAREFATVIARDNPKAASEEVEIASRASAALARIAVRLPDDQRRRLASDDDGVEAILQAVLTKVLDRPLKRRGRSAGRTLDGDGLGEPLPMDVAVGRLQAIIKPMKLEEWAGPVYGSTQLERELGIARSTLHTWRAQGAVIGLLAGLKKEVFPVAQFVDCRPVGGLAQVVSIINEPRTSWLWLISPHPELGGVAPLDRLKQGMDLRVIELARSDYGQS